MYSKLENFVKLKNSTPQHSNYVWSLYFLKKMLELDTSDNTLEMKIDNLYNLLMKRFEGPGVTMYDLHRTLLNTTPNPLIAKVHQLCLQNDINILVAEKKLKSKEYEKLSNPQKINQLEKDIESLRYKRTKLIHAGYEADDYFIQTKEHTKRVFEYSNYINDNLLK